MNEKILPSIAPAVIAGAGYYYAPSTAGSSCMDANINIGAIDTAAALAACVGDEQYKRLFCIADGLKATLATVILAKLELP